MMSDEFRGLLVVAPHQTIDQWVSELRAVIEILDKDVQVKFLSLENLKSSSGSNVSLGGIFCSLMQVKPTVFVVSDAHFQVPLVAGFSTDVGTGHTLLRAMCEAKKGGFRFVCHIIDEGRYWGSDCPTGRVLRGLYDVDGRLSVILSGTYNTQGDEQGTDTVYMESMFTKHQFDLVMGYMAIRGCSMYDILVKLAILSMNVSQSRFMTCKAHYVCVPCSKEIFESPADARRQSITEKTVLCVIPVVEGLCVQGKQKGMVAVWQIEDVDLVAQKVTETYPELRVLRFNGTLGEKERANVLCRILKTGDFDLVVATTAVVKYALDLKFLNFIVSLCQMHVALHMQLAGRMMRERGKVGLYLVVGIHGTNVGRYREAYPSACVRFPRLAGTENPYDEMLRLQPLDEGGVRVRELLDALKDSLENVVFRNHSVMFFTPALYVSDLVAVTGPGTACGAKIEWLGDATEADLSMPDAVEPACDGSGSECED